MKRRYITQYKKRLPQQLLPLPDATLIYANDTDMPVRIGYKTLRGFIKMIRQQNKILKKLGVSVQFSIILPIKG